jgi:hypothetical protein
MEFSYRISEAEYLSAWKLCYKTTTGIQIVKAVLFWLAIVVALTLVYLNVHGIAQPHPTAQQIAVEKVKDSLMAREFLVFVSPSIFVFCIRIYMTIGFEQKSMCSVYRKEPSLHGQITVNITPESISTENTVGISTKTGWNIYDYWREGKGMILLVFHSRTYFLIGLAGLSDVQRDELRGILTAVLPKK